MALEYTETDRADVRGICDICGAKAYHPRAKKCSQHREDGKEYVEAKPSGDKKESTGPAPSAAKWDSLTRKFIVIMTTLLATSIIQKAKILDPSNELEDSMAATDSEAAAMAKPFSRMLATTSFSKKYGHVIVDNEDAVDAAIAAYDYSKRVLETQRKINDVVAHRQAQQPAPPRTVPTQPNPTEAKDNGTNGQTTENGNEGPPRGVYASPDSWAYGS